MSLTFAGITLSLRWEDDFDPLVERPNNVSVEHYPETNTDEVQFGGVGQGHITLQVWLSSLADLATLEAAMANGTVGDITGLQQGTLSDMAISSITGLGYISVAGETKIKADLEFLETS